MNRLIRMRLLRNAGTDLALEIALIRILGGFLPFK